MVKNISNLWGNRYDLKKYNYKLTTNYRNNWDQIIPNVKKKSNKYLKNNIVHCWQILSNIMPKNKLGYSSLIWKSIVATKPKYDQKIFSYLIILCWHTNKKVFCLKLQIVTSC